MPLRCKGRFFYTRSMNETAHSGPPYFLDAHHIEFPDARLALEEPDGLLAVGGDLRSDRLLNAYRHGIFPWFSDDQPILWWSPNPRCILPPDQLYSSRSMKKLLRKGQFEITLDAAFAEVMRQCAAPREDQDGTWITNEMFDAYSTLHAEGHAHSVECWQDGELVGGLYGIAIGQVFFGESMFSRCSNASKAAFITLVEQLIEWGYRLIDCQVETDHLLSLGAINIPREQFLQQLNLLCSKNIHPNAWKPR